MPTLRLKKNTRVKKTSRRKDDVEYRHADRSAEVALYYGFTPLPEILSVSKEDREKARAFSLEAAGESSGFAPTLEEKVALLRYYEKHNLQERPQPFMCVVRWASEVPVRKKVSNVKISMEIMGSFKSIAEATLIQTALAILHEEKHQDLCLAINSVGDRESMGKFIREFVGYYRKNIAALPPPCRALLRSNPLELLKCEHEKCRALVPEAPKSIAFLGEESRRHFKEVLEFLEALEIPYEIDHALVGNRAFGTETIFEIRETFPERPSVCLGAGARYNNLVKRLGFKRELPSAGIDLLLQRSAKEAAVGCRVRFTRPSLFFLQLGFFAKLKSLPVIELLRQAGIPVFQALNRDKLIAQISSADNLKIPYSLILGQREALENTIIVRNNTTRSQETILLANLPEHCRKMKIG